MRGAHYLFVSAVALVSITAFAADAPKAPAADFGPSTKTIGQYVSDGWELKSTALGGRGVLMFFTQGRHLAICTLGEHRDTSGKSVPGTDQCFESQI